MSEKHAKKSIKIKLLFVLIFALLMAFSGYKIAMWMIENMHSEQIREEVSNAVIIDEKTTDKTKYNVDFNALNEINAETVAWMKVSNTNIEFPVVQTSNNDYYLSHSFDRSNNGAGWIFVDYKNKLDGTDKNIVVFGHNRRDGSMFGTLKNALNEEWYNNSENYIIPFITENEIAEYKIFALYKIEAEDYYITTNFNTNEEFQNFINTAKSRSIKNFDIDLTDAKQILTLSTCADNNKYRVVLHAVKQ